MILDDGTGNAFSAKVNANKRLYVNAVTNTHVDTATNLGNSYNLNTGLVSLTSADESTVAYLKNNEVQSLIVDTIIVGIGTMATPTESLIITAVRNPTGVSFSTAGDMNQNRNFGSSKTLTADFFKGAEAATTTGGNDIAIFMATPSSRNVFSGIGFELAKGDAMAIQIDPNHSAGVDIYVAFVCHLEDANE